MAILNNFIIFCSIVILVIEAREARILFPDEIEQMQNEHINYQSWWFSVTRFDYNGA